MKDGWIFVRNSEGQKAIEWPSLKHRKKKKEPIKLEYSENIFEKLGWNRHLQINEAERIFAGRPAL